MEMPDCPELLIWRVQWLATSVLSEHLDAIRTKPSFEGAGFPEHVRFLN